MIQNRRQRISFNSKRIFCLLTNDLAVGMEVFNTSSAEAFKERSREEIRIEIMFILLSLTYIIKEDACVYW